MGKETAPQADPLESLYKMRFSSLKIYCDSPQLLEEIEDGSIDLLLDAYHRSYARFLEYVFGERRDGISFHAFPQAKLVLTKKKDVFKALYPNPRRFDALPEWVSGYVNFKRSAYVRLVKSPRLFPSGDNSGTCHEFTHAIIPDELGFPATFLSETWPTWTHEAFAVGANQRRPIEWLKRELKSGDVKPPSARSIQSEGVFVRDSKPPYRNTGYQYCVRLAEEFGEQARDQIGPPWLNAPPLGIVCLLTQESYEQGTTLLQLAQKKGIDITKVENRVRTKLDLEPIESSPKRR